MTTKRDRAKRLAETQPDDYTFMQRDDGSWVLLADDAYAAAWGDDPYAALAEAQDTIRRYEAVVAALRYLGFCDGWESVDRWYGSSWRPVHDALAALEDR